MRPLRYLVVDDREEIVELISDVIRMSEPDGRIYCAFDGIEAVDTACNCLPDIVILDIMMPKMNGYQVCRLLKNDSRFNSTRILFLTGRSRNVDRYRGLKSGAELFVTKPFVLEELMEMIRHLREMVIADPAFDLSEPHPPRGKSLQRGDGPDLSGILTKVNDLLDRKVYEMTVINDLISAVRSDFSEEKAKEIFLTGFMNLYGLNSLIFCEPYRSSRKASMARLVTRGGEFPGTPPVILDYPFPFRMFEGDSIFFPGTGELKFGKQKSASRKGSDAFFLIHRVCESFGMAVEMAVSVKSRDKIIGLLLIGPGVDLSDSGVHTGSMELFTVQFGMVLDNMRLYRELEKQISHLARANRELTKIRGNLIRSEKIAAVASLATGVAHEINNPLGVISACVQSMLDAENLPGDVVEDLRLIKGETYRAASIIRTLLNFSRQIPLTLQSMEIVSWIHGILDSGLPGLQTDGIEIVRDIFPGRIRVEARDELFRTILLNLLSNACQAVREYDSGRGRITVSLGPTSRKKRMKLTVCDDGVGISEHNILKIFDPFFTTKPVGEGVGLGLTLVYAAVKNLRGDIKVESRQGEGSRFEITIPASGIEGMRNEKKRSGKTARR